MPDLTAGTPVLAQDMPPAVTAEEATDFNDVAGTTYAAGTPACGVTFIAPTSGRVLIHTFLLADTDATTNRIYLSTEVYRGSDATGTLVRSPGDQYGSAMSTFTTSAQSGMGWRYVDGLTPGATYYVRTVHRVSGGAVADIAHRRVTVQPLP